ncbi:MAG: DMT family transporter [Gammaproteobacteria bacterium]|jgi:drug/metabolite transporter (DMT)-like permease|nr:DMT family transporter [Gammaproteobacteria bacterium]
MTHLSEQENVLRAAAWLVLGVAGGLGLDLCAKQILQAYPLVQFVLLRSGIAMLIMLALAPRFGGYETLRSKEIGWHVVRTLFAIGAMYGFFYGLARMPLVNALTLGYTAPLIMTVLASIFLDETIGWRRWTAVSVGFAGVLIILRPGSGEFSIAAAAVLIAAFCYACQAITARRLSATESTLALSFYVVVGPLAVAIAIIDTDTWLSPDPAGWVLFCAAAVASIIAWVGFVNGYRAVSPATLAPLEYIALVGGAVAGFLIWDEVPDRWVIMGALIIISSGVFVVYRSEARKAEI